MSRASSQSRSRRISGQRGYLVVLFVVILAFMGVTASMQVLILTSVATTSRAYDSYRQGATELVRFERAVTEALHDVRQFGGSVPAPTLDAALDARLQQLSAGGARVRKAKVPSAVPAVLAFPTDSGALDPLGSVPAEVTLLLTAESAHLAGSRVACYPELTFEFESVRTVLESERTHRAEVVARMVAVPLTRFPVAAYDLPEELGDVRPDWVAGPESIQPGGLVPGRDRAFISDLQARPDSLPYHYRRRAALAEAYQQVFSQTFANRLSEYAGITHFKCLEAVSETPSIAGMTRSGATTAWDLGIETTGTYGAITGARNAVVLFTKKAGETLRLFDSGAGASLPALFVYVAGPADHSVGPLDVQLSTVSRPVVIVGCNIRVSVESGASIAGALFLDPMCSIVAGHTLTVGHLSYWAGSHSISPAVIGTGLVPEAAQQLAPRVLYIATKARRL